MSDREAIKQCPLEEAKNKINGFHANTTAFSIGRESQ
jgi:hypothetical protein